MKNRLLLGALCATPLAFATPASALFLKVEIENLAPANGVMVTPLWVGFHNGSFDLFTPGTAASAGLESIAEDGDAAAIGAEFATATAGTGNGGVVFGPGMPGTPPIFFPGQSAEMIIEVDPSNMYFSFASMVVPSNDAFIGSIDPISLYDGGEFVGLNLFVAGSQVWDAGTEVNDEIPANTAALAQAAPNTGVTENGLVALHPGFLPGGNVLAARTNGDFTLANYPIANIRVTDVTAEVIPEPSVIGLLFAGTAIVGLLLWRRR